MVLRMLMLMLLYSHPHFSQRASKAMQAPKRGARCSGQRVTPQSMTRETPGYHQSIASSFSINRVLHTSNSKFPVVKRDRGGTRTQCDRVRLSLRPLLHASKCIRQGKCDKPLCCSHHFDSGEPTVLQRKNKSQSLK
ncbi:hypothetical protein GGI42DRAFT_233095 [Trichoderma sp. SZMC 28013]